MSIKKSTPSFNSIVHSLAKNGYKLSRRDNLIFYKLLGFLIRNDKPFPYSNEKLSEQTLYKITAVKESLNNLEKLGLIIRTGFSYKRRFSKGSVLVNICTHGQYCMFLYLNNNDTHGRSPASTSQKTAGTSRKTPRIELEENKGKLKEGFAHATSTTKPHNPSYQEYAGGVIQDVKHGRLPKGTKPMTQEEFESI